MSTAELVIRWSGGSLDLMGWNSGTHGDFLVETLADGTNWGSPETVRTMLRTALRDGSRTRADRDENRTIPLKLRVKAPDHSALAGGEQALDLIDGRRCELVWTPPGDLGIAPSVFAVDFADLSHEMNDLGYARGELFYTLTLSCLPHAYADSWITVPALVQASSVPVAVDDCTSTSGWSVTGATLSAASGALLITPTAGATAMTATRTGAINLTTDRFLAVWGNQPTTVEVLSGTTWTAIPQVVMDGNYYIFNGTGLTDPTVDAVRFTWTAAASGKLVARSLADIRKQAAPRSTLARQQMRSIEVPGSRRTPATVHVQSPTTGLKTVILYGGPQYNPALSRGAIQARSTTSTTLSGSQGRLNSGSSVTFIVPASDFYSGSHAMHVVSRPVAGGVTTAGTLTATVTLLASGGALISNLGAITRSFGWADGEVKTALMGSVDLPGAILPEDTTTFVSVQLNWTKDPIYGPTDERDLWVDEVLVFNRTLGRLAILNNGDKPYLWVESADLDRDHDVVFGSFGAKANAVPLSTSTEMPAWMGALEMSPGMTYLYVGTTGALDTTVEATFRPAGNTHMPASA